MKKWILILISCSSFYFTATPLAFSQGWEKSIGTAENEEAYSVVATLDGNYVAAGVSNAGMGIDPEKEAFLVKFDGSGTVIWTQVYEFSDPYERIGRVIATADGGFLLVGNTSAFGENQKATLAKVNSNGVEEWTYIFETANSVNIFDIVESNGTDGGFIFCGYEEFADQDLLIGKIDSVGTLLWTKTYDESLNDYGTALVESPQGEIIIVGVTNRDGIGRNYGLAFKADANGNKIWSTNVTSMYRAYEVFLQPDGSISVLGNGPRLDYIDRISPDGLPLWSANPQFDWSSDSYGASPTADGGFIITGWSFETQQSQTAYAFLLKVDSLGNKEWNRQYPRNMGSRGNEVIQTPDGGFLMAGAEFPEIFQADAYLVKTDSLGRLFTHLLVGLVAHDTSLDCLVDTTERELENWVIEARKSSGRAFYASSDREGRYEMEIDTGDYEVTIHSSNSYWDVCIDSIPITVATFFDTTTIDFALQTDIACPYMTVDVGVPFLRRCFDNIYSVNYCNLGTVTADSAYVDVTLDPFMSFTSSSIPAQMIAPDLYRFQLGNVSPGVCNSLFFTVYLDCDSTILGQNHCVEAHIYPDSLCIPSNNNWSGAFIEVDGECQDSLLNFKIENTGSGAMNNPLHYVIIEDAILLMTAPFELGPGTSQDVPIPNNGSTYLIYAEQEPGAPGNSIPILSFEGCVPSPGLPFSTGFVNQFPLNDANPFIDIDCRPNIGSYDPNDKQGFPIGYGPEHLIEANTDIEYLIRFQNTGTDTAFTVVIQDTLTQWLNPGSIQPGASSHNYDFNLSKGGIITFTFNNIMLPDSNVNQLASNGFVKFRISQREDNPIGTRIENSAAIFFDFNPPIITNTTFHTIGEDLIDIILDTENPAFPLAQQIKVYPNPIQQNALFDLGEQEITKGQFMLYNAAGQILRRTDFSGNRFSFERQDLPAGFYLFNIQQAGQTIGQGKIIIH